jgi:hypothetical protein
MASYPKTGHAVAKYTGEWPYTRDPYRQTVYRDSRTSRPSMSSANLLANTYTCRQRSALAAANAQDTAELNLPVNSQTVLGACS